MHGNPFQDFCFWQLAGFEIVVYEIPELQVVEFHQFSRINRALLITFNKGRELI